MGSEEVGELVVGRPAQQPHPRRPTRALPELVAAPPAQALRAARLSELLPAS